MVVNIQEKKKIVVVFVKPSDNNIMKKEHEKIEKYQELTVDLGRMWGIKISVVPMMIGTVWVVTPKLGEWLQQIPETTSEISVLKSTILA